jgi:hypothetical protein
LEVKVEEEEEEEEEEEVASLIPKVGEGPNRYSTRLFVPHMEVSIITKEGEDEGEEREGSRR